jgi:hypothetical protein
MLFFFLKGETPSFIRSAAKIKKTEAIKTKLEDEFLFRKKKKLRHDGT